VFFQKSVGVNIEKDCVAIVSLKAGFRKVGLEKSAVYPLDRDASREDRMKKVRDCINEFTAGRQLVSASLHVALPREMVLIRHIELPASVKHNIRETLVYEMRKYTPFSADDVYFDFHVVSESKETSRIHILLACAKKDDVNGVFEPLSHTHLKGVSGIEWSSSALSNYFIERGTHDGQERLAVIYVNDDVTEFTVIENKQLLSSHQMRSGADEHNLSTVVEKEVQRYNETGKHGAKDPVIICGKGANDFSALKEKQSYNISIYEGESYESDDPSIIVARGLALKGLHKVPVQYNFLPSALRKKPSNIPIISLIILCVLLVFSAGTLIGGKVFQTRVAMSKIDQEIQRYRSEVADIKKLKATVDALETDVVFLDNVRKNSISTLSFLRELSNEMPSTAWLDRLYLRDDEIRLYGYAQSATDLLTVLESSPIFSDVAFVSPITKDKRGREKFRITMKVSSPKGTIAR